MLVCSSDMDVSVRSRCCSEVQPKQASHVPSTSDHLYSACPLSYLVSSQILESLTFKEATKSAVSRRVSVEI